MYALFVVLKGPICGTLKICVGIVDFLLGKCIIRAILSHIPGFEFHCRHSYQNPKQLLQ